MAKNRFKKVYAQGVSERIKIYVDTQTGVNYLMAYYGPGLGIAPLLDKDGKPVVTPVNK